MRTTTIDRPATPARGMDAARASGAIDGGRPATSASADWWGRPNMTLLRRLNLFWLLTIVALLVGGGVSASQHDPALWRSWRGPAMAALSLAFIGWYLLLTQRRPRHDWPPPRRAVYPWLTAGFIITALLLPFDRTFLGLTYALMGASMMLPLKEMVVPVGVAILMNVWSLSVLRSAAGGWSWTDALGGSFDIAIGVGTVLAIIALVRERFRREHLFAELSEAHRQLRLSAAREADLAALRERNRLAREMHDSLGHALVSIAVKLEAIQLLYPVDAPRAEAELEGTTRLVRATMTDLRRSLEGLRPAALEERALGDALAEMAREMAGRTGVAASCAVDERASLLDRAVQEALYRVTQEALTNVAKHARAAHVAVSLALRDGRAHLEVADDGVGLAAGAAERDGMEKGAGRFGVLGMRERVEALGGVVTLGPRPGGGAVLRASVPASGAA